MKSRLHHLSLLFLLAAVPGLIANAQPAKDTDYLARALDAERFVSSLQFDGKEGKLWRTTPESGKEPDYSLYYGSGGIALFYLELYHATSNTKYLETAISAGDEILAALPQMETGRISISSGLGARVFVLGELFRETQFVRFADGARLVLAQLRETSKELGTGVSWIEQNPYAAYNPANTNIGEMYDLSIGAAGAGLVFLYAQRLGIDDEGTAWAVRVGDRLLEVAESTDDGLRWPMMDNLPAPLIMPNFAHGPAGIAYFLADLHRATQDKRYLDAAISAARYVQSRTMVKGDGILVCHHENPEPSELFYLGYCHGPAGTGRLMYLLYTITGDEEWMDWIHRNMAGLAATGAPETRSEGFWNNHSQCCGDAGLGDFSLYLYRATKDKTYLDLAKRIANYLVADADRGTDTLSWSQAEMRIKPEALATHTGYMQGAAGIGSFLLHLAFIDSKPVKIPLLATPFE